MSTPVPALGPVLIDDRPRPGTNDRTLEAELLDRAARDDYQEWLGTAMAAGGCVRPIRLRGTVCNIDATTGKTQDDEAIINEPVHECRVTDENEIRARLDRDPWAAAGLLQIGTVAPWASGSTAARARARGQHRVRPAPASPADRFGRMKSLLPVADRAVSSQPSWSRIWREGSQPGP